MAEPSTNGNGLELESLGTGAAPGSTAPRMLVPLFLVPLLIVGVLVGLFVFLGSVLGREKSVTEWVELLEDGGVNERWHAAVQLADVARREPETLAAPEVRARLRQAFVTAGPSEPRLRRYLAVLWAHVDDPDAAPLMVEGIERSMELIQHREQHPREAVENAEAEILHYIQALGRVGNSTHEPRLRSMADDSDGAVRQVVAEALGVMGRKAIKAGSEPSAELVTTLTRLNEDPDPWVRMNAALSLGKVDRLEGIATLEAMLDREWLKSQGLRFPDDGRFDITSHDPAADKIGQALLALDSLLAADRVAARIDRAAVRAAVSRAASDPNPELQRRANALLAKLAD